MKPRFIQGLIDSVSDKFRANVVVDDSLSVLDFQPRQTPGVLSTPNLESLASSNIPCYVDAAFGTALLEAQDSPLTAHRSIIQKHSLKKAVIQSADGVFQVISPSIKHQGVLGVLLSIESLDKEAANASVEFENQVGRLYSFRLTDASTGSIMIMCSRQGQSGTYDWTPATIGGEATVRATPTLSPDSYDVLYPDYRISNLDAQPPVVNYLVRNLRIRNAKVYITTVFLGLPAVTEYAAVLFLTSGGTETVISNEQGAANVAVPQVMSVATAALEQALQSNSSLQNETPILDAVEGIEVTGQFK
jgi:hypothetical protein